MGSALVFKYFPKGLTLLAYRNRQFHSCSGFAKGVCPMIHDFF